MVKNFKKFQKKKCLQNFKKTLLTLRKSEKDFNSLRKRELLKHRN